MSMSFLLSKFKSLFENFICFKSLDHLANESTATRTRPRMRISAGDSISLSEAQTTRPTTSGKQRSEMKRCVSAKLGLNEIGASSRDVARKKAPQEIENVVIMKEVVKRTVGKVSTSNDEQRPRSPPLITLTNVTVDTSKAKSNSDVIRMCLRDLGWHECPKGGPGCDIVWQSCTTSHEGRDLFNSTPNNAINATIVSQTSLVSSTRINKFPCNFEWFSKLLKTFFTFRPRNSLLVPFSLKT